jgi:hypothetical protein
MSRFITSKHHLADLCRCRRDAISPAYHGTIKFLAEKEFLWYITMSVGGMSARRRIYIGSTPLLNHILK